MVEDFKFSHNVHIGKIQVWQISKYFEKCWAKYRTLKISNFYVVLISIRTSIFQKKFLKQYNVNIHHYLW